MVTSQAPKRCRQTNLDDLAWMVPRHGESASPQGPGNTAMGASFRGWTLWCGHVRSQRNRGSNRKNGILNFECLILIFEKTHQQQMGTDLWTWHLKQLKHTQHIQLIHNYCTRPGGNKVSFLSRITCVFYGLQAQQNLQTQWLPRLEWRPVGEVLWASWFIAVWKWCRSGSCHDLFPLLFVWDTVPIRLHWLYSSVLNRPGPWWWNMFPMKQTLCWYDGSCPFFIHK